MLEQVREWLSSAAYPVQVAVDLPFRAWDWVTGSFADRSRLRQENLELTARLRLANLQLQRFAALEDENRRLRDMRENSAGVADRVLVASILNVDLDPFRHRVLVDKGRADGVFKGQAALDADGIFGQVWRVNEHSAEGIMITDAEHAIPVQSNRSGVRTIAVGTGDLNRLSLPFVTVESDLKAGDLLLSTGMGGVFPPGYPVAKATKGHKHPNWPQRQGKVQLVFCRPDLTGIEAVRPKNRTAFSLPGLDLRRREYGSNKAIEDFAFLRNV